MTRKRTRAREVALQALYQLEANRNGEYTELDTFFAEQNLAPEVLNFTTSLVAGCRSHKKEIEEKIASISDNWDIHRMAIIDRCILQLSVYELIYRDDIPPKVSINEAIDLAKKFSTENSGTFVNGILDKIYANVERQNI
ncbi:MAG: transcription antitermination factor NusB [Candidatus Anammoxibacter sp.]